VADPRELQRKLRSSEALRDIVTAMRNLAAIYVRRAEAAVGASRPYSDVVETALGVLLRRAGLGSPPAEPEGRCLALVFASDQGLCGTYNDRVVRAALEFREGASGQMEFVAVGLRGAALLRIRGAEPVMSIRSPTSLEGIKAQVTEIAADIFETYLEHGAARMAFVYNAYEGMGRSSAQVRTVLPPSMEGLGEGKRKEFRAEPILTAPPRELLPAMFEEYFFIQLYRALLESHASENGARLISMTAAATNIDKRLLHLTQQFQTARQDMITAELLDVVGGAEALRSED